MADTLKRLSNLIRGMSLEWMAEAEAENPRAVVKSAMEGARQRYDEAARTLARLKAQDKGADDEARRIEAELGDLRAQRAALGPEHTDLAARLDDAIARLAARQETLATEDVQRAQLADELAERSAALQRELQQLKQEEDSLVARHLSAREEVEASSLSSGTPTRAYERALQSVRERAERTRTATEQGAPSSEELGRLKAEARLAALKAERANRTPTPPAAPSPAPTAAPAPAAPAPAAPAPDAEPAPPPSPLPRREL